jgi:hypothetical protein
MYLIKSMCFTLFFLCSLYSKSQNDAKLSQQLRNNFNKVFDQDFKIIKDTIFKIDKNKYWQIKILPKRTGDFVISYHYKLNRPYSVTDIPHETIFSKKTAKIKYEQNETFLRIVDKSSAIIVTNKELYEGTSYYKRSGIRLGDTILLIINTGSTQNPVFDNTNWATSEIMEKAYISPENVNSINSQKNKWIEDPAIPQINYITYFQDDRNDSSFNKNIIIYQAFNIKAVYPGKLNLEIESKEGPEEFSFTNGTSRKSIIHNYKKNISIRIIDKNSCVTTMPYPYENGSAYIYVQDPKNKKIIYPIDELVLRENDILHIKERKVEIPRGFKQKKEIQVLVNKEIQEVLQKYYIFLQDKKYDPSIRKIFK